MKSNLLIQNLEEFEAHYNAHRQVWDKSFDWLNNTNLSDISTGKYSIDEDAFAIVSEYVPKPIHDTRFEAHRKFIDLQCLVSGKEKMGVAPLSKAVESGEFNDDNDIGFYTVPEEECQYYIAKAGKLLVFFPGDAHRPGIKAEKGEGVKKVVIKIKF